MEVTRTEDKNGAGNVIVSGYTTAVATGTRLDIHIAGRVYNGGTVDGDNHYQRFLPADLEFDTVEIWTTEKFEPRMIDSFTTKPAEEAVEEPTKVKKPRKKAV